MYSGCMVRFTHANRRCSEHLNARLVRDDEGALQQILLQANQMDVRVQDWLKKHIQSR